MSLIDYRPLSTLERPLLNKFYRNNGSAMRAAAKGELWVARAGDIVAALSLSEVPAGFWLSGLLVAPAWRNRQIARQLIAHARQGKPGTLWLFCHPELEGFYSALGFAAADTLPPALTERLARYQRSKALLAMGIDHSSALGSSPGNNTSVKPNLLKS